MEKAPLIHVAPVAASDLSRIDVPPGFRAIVQSEDVRGVLLRVLDAGGTVTAACAGSLLAGYATGLPFLPVMYGGRRLRRPWEDLPQARECGSIEVAALFRRRRVAKALLAAMVANGRLENWIVIGEAVSSHWDLRDSGLGVWRYRAMLLRLFEPAGFHEFETSEPKDGFDPASFLVAKVGARTSRGSQAAFFARLAGR